MSPFLSYFPFISFKLISLEYFEYQSFFTSLSCSYSVKICFELKFNYSSFYKIKIFIHLIHLAYNSKHRKIIKCHFAYLYLWIYIVWYCIWINYCEFMNLSPAKFSNYHYSKLIKGIYFLNGHFYLLHG